MADDIIELNEELGLYLRPMAKLMITIILPEKKIVGKMISNWEVMETIKKKISPEVFLSLKVCTSSMTKVLLEGEVESLSHQADISKKLHRNWIKLSGFQDKFNIVAEPAKIKILKKSEWESYFNNAPHFDGNKPGERPDTVRISELPTAWFKSLGKERKDTIFKTFSKFGEIARVEVPALDSYDTRINNMMETGCDSTGGFRKTSFMAPGLLFDVYIQFSNTSGFAACVDRLNGMKLVRIFPKEADPFYCNFKLEFDRTGRLSASVIETRRKLREDIIERDRLIFAESEAKKSEEEKISEEKHVQEEKRLKEAESKERTAKKVNKKKEFKKKLREEQRLTKIDADIEFLKKHIDFANQCRKFSAIELISTALGRIRRQHRRTRFHEKRPSRSRSPHNHSHVLGKEKTRSQHKISLK